MFPGLTGKTRNNTLIEMLCGIVLCGVFGQIVILLCLPDKAFVSAGWWIGIITAMGSAYHMWWGLDRALSLRESDATKMIISYNMIRYVVIIAIMGIVMVTEVANPLAAVLGVFGLKAGAYIQPFIHRIGKRFIPEAFRQEAQVSQYEGGNHSDLE